MPDDITSISVTVNSDEFRDAAEEFRESIEAMIDAAETLEESAIYVDDPMTGNPTRIEVSELLDVLISVDVSGKATLLDAEDDDA